jgi:integrase
MLLDDYGLKGNRTTMRARQCFGHITEFFRGETVRALDITSDTLVSYAKARQESGAALATVKYELALLRRAFNLAVRAERLPQRPAFPVIECRNRRRGFFEDGEFRAVLEQLPEDVAPVAEFLYWTGWRVGEALALEWRQVDLATGVIRLEDSKNGEARVLPYKALPELARMIHGQRERTEAVQQARGVIVTHVFHRNGQPILSFRGAWDAACRRAGLPHRLAHDFRRTAARNMSRAGVPEQVIMAICGWETRSVFDRYRIVAERDLAEGLAKLASQVREPEAPKVVRLRTGTVRAQ